VAGAPLDGGLLAGADDDADALGLVPPALGPAALGAAGAPPPAGPAVAVCFACG
jgi:hypothetical protein